ncbi:RT0821/Lpp0805 family surface protein [Notoacmeibacter sp. MSK16QG-6]|nr:RT0821/Lpp0805 family surface protein [Notoacmeibacter sp. MSK16QG-6]
MSKNPSRLFVLRGLAILLGGIGLAGCTTLTGGAPSSAFAPSSATGGSVGMVNGLAARPASGLSVGSSQTLALAAEYRALEYKGQGETVSWQSDNGESGRVVAYQPYRVGRQDCRQFTHTLTIEGDIRALKGAACRTEDGSWTVI